MSDKAMSGDPCAYPKTFPDPVVEEYMGFEIRAIWYEFSGGWGWIACPRFDMKAGDGIDIVPDDHPFQGFSHYRAPGFAIRDAQKEIDAFMNKRGYG